MAAQWNEIVEAHRRDAREAILDAAATLVTEHGAAAVTMSRIAATAGIGRATLYKYFSDLDAVLSAWHQRHVDNHLHELSQVRDQHTDPGQRLKAVLTACAHLVHHRPGADLAWQLHHNPDVARAYRHVHNLVSDLIAEAAEAGAVHADATPDELAAYCLHALTAASALQSKAAVDRLVAVTLNGLTHADERTPGMPG
ncbi:TetR/AcrR family transcriptional regulator [Actinocrispum wychmicini]|uniref:TetR/AcrR family transcriptional regulator n=1 Tax=Actinocrispum wychmicini TaxID=1213861 RepID=UPI00104654EA|nr:TetR/AcrR family transcriptional regulator [Actinocrispum wychmicini]